MLPAVFAKFGVSGPSISRSSPIDHFLKEMHGKPSVGFPGFGKHNVESTFGFSGLRKHDVKSMFGFAGLQLLADSLESPAALPKPPFRDSLERNRLFQVSHRSFC